MKQIILFLIFTFSISISAQQMYWYDVILDVEGKHTNAFEKTVDNYYSSKDFPIQRHFVIYIRYLYILS